MPNSKKILCRDYVGKTVELRSDIRTNGGTEFKQGERLFVRCTHRGRFTLQDKQVPDRSISRVGRNQVTLIDSGEAADVELAGQPLVEKSV